MKALVLENHIKIYNVLVSVFGWQSLNTNLASNGVIIGVSTQWMYNISVQYI